MQLCLMRLLLHAALPNETPPPPALNPSVILDGNTTSRCPKWRVLKASPPTSNYKGNLERPVRGGWVSGNGQVYCLRKRDVHAGGGWVSGNGQVYCLRKRDVRTRGGWVSGNSQVYCLRKRDVRTREGFEVRKTV